MVIALVDEGNQGSGVQEDVADHCPNPSMYLGLVDKSPGPCTQPTKSPAKSSADGVRALVGASFKNPSNAERTSADLLSPRCLAARSSLAFKPNGSFKDRVFMGTSLW